MTEKARFWEDLKSGRFLSMVKESSKGRYVSNSHEVYNVMKPVFAEHDDVESVYCIFLDAKNKIIAIEKMFVGSITASTIYTRELVKHTLALKATALILTHNHPSGCTNPSPEDKTITLKIWIALASIDVALHDHIIVGDGHYSMADADFLNQARNRYETLMRLIE
jgi:DNA repair protein RadC